MKYDTDENGVNDADDDMDSDGLSNKEEIGLGTSVSSADTDEDGLSDYDELNKHNTDTLKSDSDADSFNDGELNHRSINSPNFTFVAAKPLRHFSSKISACFWSSFSIWRTF